MNVRLLGACLLICATSLALATDFTVPGNFPSIQAAVDSSSVLTGDRILVGAGDYAGAVLNKSITIQGADGARITSGPIHASGMSQGFRLVAGSSGATLSHLTFTTDLAIMNAGGRNGTAPVDDVTVTQCTFLSCVQGVTNWVGSAWDISHNTFHDLRCNNGGGIAILLGDFQARLDGIQNNVVSHNTIDGVLHVASSDQGGYNGSGIVLYADFRWGATGATQIAYNRVVKNKISVVSDTPSVVDFAAFELTDTRNDAISVIHDNEIGFNDFRGTTLQIDLTPDQLSTNNTISRNFGDNRGHGLHPSLFGPGG